MEGHWTETIEHERFTPEVKQSLAKYESIEDAVLGGVEAQKLVGKKLENVIQRPGKDAKPEELRAFHEALAKELGAVDDEKGLEDLNLVDGLPEGSKADDAMAGSFKKFVLENKIPKPIAGKMVGFYNKMMVTAREQAENQARLEMEAVNNDLIKTLGSKEKVAEASELVRRMFQNHAGLTPEEYESAGKGLIDSGITKNAALARAMFKLAEKYKEASSDAGTGAGKSGKSQYEKNKEMFPASPELWGEPGK